MNPYAAIQETEQNRVRQYVSATKSERGIMLTEQRGREERVAAEEATKRMEEGQYAQDIQPKVYQKVWDNSYTNKPHTEGIYYVVEEGLKDGTLLLPPKAMIYLGPPPSGGWPHVALEITADNFDSFYEDLADEVNQASAANASPQIDWDALSPVEEVLKYRAIYMIMNNILRKYPGAPKEAVKRFRAIYNSWPEELKGAVNDFSQSRVFKDLLQKGDPQILALDEAIPPSHHSTKRRKCEDCQGSVITPKRPVPPLHIRKSPRDAIHDDDASHDSIESTDDEGGANLDDENEEDDL
jgi:hypothetical protein